VLDRASAREQMSDALAMRHQPIRNMRAVALGGIAFRTHQAHRLHSIGKRSGRVAEQGGPHVHLVRTLAIAAKGLALPFVGYAGILQRGGERLARELRMAARNGKGAHVDQRAYLRFLKNRDQLRGAARAVTDREDQAAFAAFCSSRFSVFFFFSSGFGSAPGSARSISVTSASGALSPLRKPVLRMRR
jgi:hypothetical protein